MPRIIEDIKAFYREFHETDLQKLPSIYSERATFADPVHTLRGVDEIQHYFESGRQGLIHCRFDYFGQIVEDESASLEWTMVFSHRRLKSGKPIQVAGCTVFEFDSTLQQVLKQVDYYDLGTSLYEHIPLLGMMVRAVKSNLAS